MLHTRLKAVMSMEIILRNIHSFILVVDQNNKQQHIVITCMVGLYKMAMGVTSVNIQISIDKGPHL